MAHSRSSHGARSTTKMAIERRGTHAPANQPEAIDNQMAIEQATILNSEGFLVIPTAYLQKAPAFKLDVARKMSLPQMISRAVPLSGFLWRLDNIYYDEEGTPYQIIAFDIDGKTKAERELLLNVLKGYLGETIVVLTGRDGGAHVYVKYRLEKEELVFNSIVHLVFDNRERRDSKWQWWMGIPFELRAGPNFMMVPYSHVTNNGSDIARYEILNPEQYDEPF